MNRSNGCQAILCAAGLSSRMGADNKLLLPYKGSTIIEHSLSQLIASQVSRIILVTGHDHEIISNKIEPFLDHIDLAYNEAYRQGHTSSIKTGVEQLDSKASSFMICLADMPLLITEHFNQLMSFYKAQEEGSFVRPTVNNRPGHPVIFDISYREAMMNCQSQSGCREVIMAHMSSGRFYHSTEEAYFTDVDTPTSYQNLIK